MTTIIGTKELAEINQKVVQNGEVLPQVKLKDGSRVQTGTVATMLHNINLYNAGVRGAVEEELILAVPTLFKVGMFDLFSADEWINGTNAGRRFVGEQAKQFLADRI
ncbi:MAG: hypothetical protein BGN93_20215 [Acinetobacter sp. 39-4]|uniref:DUF7709 domain-containing protein n=1 Tax=Acinetobacter modestus TaxID=1776740 RepID=N9NQY4_9GAMM|nr:MULTISPECIES: hypothetical protein [Acinetobacter]OJU55230.1 MAG: hypothetical protein BGN93_20215 [Acinetobacter sp. 39-4]OJU89240.1 MAG: hypothetical protein BGO19_15845 [Acinetobacter sp. 38-8]ENX04365.1 hypothetical protein F900_00355 [Acinetobacter modestus]KKW80854.1 hypothetical protein AAV96_04665 [Acinetobacter sp. AG1]MCH7330827.1 hypothetical protein [Acinetobacter modestus]